MSIYTNVALFLALRAMSAPGEALDKSEWRGELPHLVAKHLPALERAGAVRTRPSDGGYVLTPAGKKLATLYKSFATTVRISKR